MTEHNEKVCRTQELGYYAQGQGHSQVRGQIVPKIVLLINYLEQPPVLFCNTGFLQTSLVFLVFLDTLNHLKT